MKALNKDFGIHEVVMWAAKCSRCKKALKTGDLIAMSAQDELKDMLRFEGWLLGGEGNKFHPGNCWCPDCYAEEKNGEVYVKSGRP